MSIRGRGDGDRIVRLGAAGRSFGVLEVHLETPLADLRDLHRAVARGLLQLEAIGRDLERQFDRLRRDAPDRLIDLHALRIVAPFVPVADGVALEDKRPAAAEDPPQHDLAFLPVLLPDILGPFLQCRTPKDLTAFPPDKVPVKTGQGFGAEV